MLPVSGSLLAAPPFPRPGPSESGSPTSKVILRCYDFPPTHSRSLICFASGAHVTPPLLRARCFQRSRGGEGPTRARIIVQPAILIAGSLSRGREWNIPGSQTIHPVPLLRSRTPAESTIPRRDGLVDAAPALSTAKASAIVISRLPRGFSTCCLRFTGDVATARARLASGWLASLYREGVEPSGLLRKVSELLHLFPLS